MRPITQFFGLNTARLKTPKDPPQTLFIGSKAILAKLLSYMAGIESELEAP